MVRNSSDMVLLLGSRGRSRGRGKSGLFSSLGRVFKGLIGGPSSESSDLLRRSGRKAASSGWIVLVAALVCFAGGYLTGSHFGGKPKEGDALRADAGPRTPGVIEFDASPITSEAFIVSFYRGLPAAEAKTKAKELCDYLRTQGLKQVRPYEWQTKVGPVWVAAVYFDGDAEEKMQRVALLALPEDVPDEVFVSLRKSDQNWPKAWRIQ